MKCTIQWIDRHGKPTPDDHEAVAMAHFHTPVWSHPCGHEHNRIVGHKPEIQQSFPICAEHLAQAQEKEKDFRAWSFTPLEKGRE
jgi:hypothetical protein